MSTLYSVWRKMYMHKQRGGFVIATVSIGVAMVATASILFVKDRLTESMQLQQDPAAVVEEMINGSGQ